MRKYAKRPEGGNSEAPASERAAAPTGRPAVATDVVRMTQNVPVRSMKAVMTARGARSYATDVAPFAKNGAAKKLLSKST